MPQLNPKDCVATRKARCFYLKFYCYATQSNSERYGRSVLRKLAIQRVRSNRLSVIYFIEERRLVMTTQEIQSAILILKDFYNECRKELRNFAKGGEISSLYFSCDGFDFRFIVKKGVVL